jgi:dienelactone hydrolase
MRITLLTVTVATLGCGQPSASSTVSFHPVDPAGRIDSSITISGSLRLPPVAARRGRPHPAVIVVHGLRGDRNQLAYLVDSLAVHGLAVLNIDIRGHGRSTGEFPFNAPEWYGIAADDVAGAIGWLKASRHVDTSRIGLIGASLGGGAVLASALRYQLPVVAWYPGLTYAFEQDSLVNVRSPTLHGLIVHGSRDAVPRAAPELTMRFAAGNPKVSLVTIEGGEHGPGRHRELYLRLTIDSLTTWLGADH